MEKVNVTLDISCLATCPKCGDIFDLFEIESLIEEGYIYGELLPNDDTWGKDHWGEIVECPECSEKMVINEIAW